MKTIARLAAVLALAPIFVGCGSSREVTDRSLREARQVWTRADLRDYDLEWRSSGLRSGHYLVTVRGGRVEEVQSVLTDGRTMTVRPGDPSFYSVDGLFQTLEDELDQARSDRPFGQPKGARVVLQFDPDPELGYPRSYRRDVVGAPKGLAIDVLRLESRPAEETHGSPP